MPTEHATFERTDKGERPIVYAACVECDKSTMHAILFGYDMRDYEIVAPGKGSPDGHQSYQIIQCQGCNAVSFRQTIEPFLPVDENGEPFGDDVKLFPHRLAGRKPLGQIWPSVPRKVAEIYRQTHFALCSGCPILAGIGIRSLIEAVCAEKKATGKDLQKKIDSLVGGILTAEMAEILHELRLIGNKTVHEIDPPSDHILNAAMDVAEHLLETVWIIPYKAKMLKRDREKKEKGTTPKPTFVRKAPPPETPDK